MKHLHLSLRLLPLALLVVLGTMTAGAYDFLVDGIYYNINYDKTTVAVAPKSYGAWPNGYRDTVIVPETVTYNEKTYTVTKLSNEAFAGSYHLKVVVLPNTITVFDRATFEHCHELVSVNIPEGVTTVGNYTFSNCYELSSLHIPSTLTNISFGFNWNCPALSTITVDPGNTVYDSRDNCNAIIETATNTLVFGCQSTVIPNTVTRINKNSFPFQSQMQSISFPPSVKEIGYEAFMGCSALQTLYIPATVDTIAPAAFGYCSGLLSITVDENNPNYDSRNNCNAIIEKESRTILAACRNTTFPSTARRIGEYAFAGCAEITNLTIPNTIVSIGECAFTKCTGLTTMILPNSIRSIGFEAFYDCTGISVLYLPNSITSLGNYAFQNLTSLKSVTVPISITSIPMGLFCGCENLTTVNLPNTLRVIGDDAFYQCTSLETVLIPDSVVDVGSWTFGHCYGLKYLTIPDLVTEYDDVVMGCSSIESLTLGRGLENMKGSFWSCNKLTSITCLGTKPPVMKDNINSNIYANAVLRVPNESISDYLATNYWYKFAHIQGLTEIQNGDANCDGTIDISDLSYLIDCLLGDGTAPLPVEYGDLNQNGVIDIDDVALFVDLLLNL